MLHEENHTVCDLLGSAFFHSEQFFGDSSKFFNELIVHFFLLLSGIS